MSKKNSKTGKKTVNTPPTKKEEIIAYVKDNIIFLSACALITVLSIIALIVILVKNFSANDGIANNSGYGDIDVIPGEDNEEEETPPSEDGGSGSDNNTDSTKTQYKNTSFDYFDTKSYIIGYESSVDEFSDVSVEALDLLGEYHKLFDIYNEYDGINNLCTINKNAGGEPIKVDEKIIDMLLFAKEMYYTTDGKMNIAMGSVLSIWHDYRTEGLNNPSQAQLPGMDELTKAAEHTNIEDIIIDKENGTVYLRDPDMKLDVGAFAKGYAVEMVAQMLESMGKTDYVVNVGGNIRTTGTKANGDPWKTGVENPTGDYETPYIEHLYLTDCAIVSSGSYQRYYVVNGKRYHHIIDQETLMPSEKGFLLVSVVCENSAIGDGLSTALFCMTLEEGMALINSLDGVEAMWYTTDEVKYYSEGFDYYIAEAVN